MGMLWLMVLNDATISQVFSSRTDGSLCPALTDGENGRNHFGLIFRLSFRAELVGVRCNERGVRRDIAMFPIIIFLPLIFPCSSFSLWEQIQDPAGSSSSSSSSPVQNNAGVSGGFWGSLLGHSQQQSGGEHNTFRNSQRNPQIERADENSKRQILPSSLRSLHTLHPTEYEDDGGEMFTREETRTDQHFNTHPHQ